MTTSGENLREIVLDVLLSVLRDGNYSHITLSLVLDKYQYLSKQERGFITRLTMGTLERMLEMDYIINEFSSVKVNKIKPVILCILRMSVYQLKYMDNVPDSAVCNEAVKLAGKRGFKNLKGFVNGVLRNIGRNLSHIPYPDREKQPIKALSLDTSLPEWIIGQWSRDYGFQKAESIARSLIHQGKTAIRVNFMKTDKEHLTASLKKQNISVEDVVLPDYPDFKDALYIWDYDYLLNIEEFLQGHFYVQDISSMLITYLLAPKQGDYIIDVCAAPGGKSLHAAQLMEGTGMVEARDLTDKKIALIQENISRCNVKNVKAVKWDACLLDKAAPGRADKVIADLPCSGLGVMGKKPDIRYRMTRKQEEELTELQRRILGNTCEYVKPGGILMYSTCTIDKMENEENTQWFLENHPEFSLMQQRQIFPDEGSGDGFYLAKMIRSGI